MNSPPESRNSAETPPDPFDEYKDDIKAMIDDYSNAEIVQELFTKGFQTSTRSLQRRLQNWGFRRQSGARGTNIGASGVLKEAINQLFHSTLLNDNQIGARLTERGLQTTGRQVKTIRLKSGWQRHSTGAQKAARAAQTLHQVEQVVTHGPGRTFGRGWMITYLRQHCGFKAHQNDVATAQRQLNPEAVP
jgi:hypothetical protein